MGVVQNIAASLQNLDPGPRLADAKAIVDALSGAGGLSTSNAITASTVQTQAGGNGKLGAVINRVTVGNASDAITMPKAVPGMAISIINVTGQTLQLFPFLGDKINAAVTNAAVTVADATTSDYYCAVANIWNGGATTNES